MDQPAESPAQNDPELDVALRHKRTALDREVEAFRAAKDAEFREYEVQVRARRASSSAGAGPGIDGASDQAARPTAPVPGSRGSSATGTKPAKRPLRKSRSPGGGGGGEGGGGRGGGRELRSLFAPYAELMDTRTGAGDAAVGSAGAEPSRAPRPSPPKMTQTSTDLASPAASTSSDPFGSAGRAASPQPRRASSSPAGTPRLRSSLRQPGSPQRPGGAGKAGVAGSGSSTGRMKHVLFAIDDVLLSPSSSPLAKREGGAVAHRPPTPVAQPAEKPSEDKAEFESEKADDQDRLEAERKEEKATGARGIVKPQGRGTQGDEAEEEEDAIMIPRISPARIPRPPALLASPPSRSYKDLLELKPTEADAGGGQAEALDGPDVDEVAAGMGDEDPLFAFDDAGEAEWADEEGASGASGRQAGAGAEGTEQQGRQAEEESPMAGSVPIEIRWPGRRS